LLVILTTCDVGNILAVMLVLGLALRPTDGSFGLEGLRLSLGIGILALGQDLNVLTASPWHSRVDLGPTIRPWLGTITN